MRASSDHLSAAIRTEEFVMALSALPVRYPEWEVTALFYSALHYVNAYLRTQGHSPRNHVQRNEIVYSLTNVGVEYEALFRESIRARYNFVRFTPQEVDEIRTGPFRRVKEEMLSLLGT